MTKRSGGSNETSASIWYYASFHVEVGSEWSSMYGMLVEGDQGTLTFQGARYLGFERNSPSQSV
ncbi:DUF2500 domain-containing protein [Fictibacillus sp. 7GRE50]|uniref:DUF2500 family protein n=1 Tax=Fictibacillus sp. 7GRE50 TaxID=2745878 RepID=UPI0018CF37D5|nr:DUF2500 domain-containing protein [Fictibacillus sp. 7GRE50]